MIVVSGPISAPAGTAPVCITVTGAGPNPSLTVGSGPPALRVSRSGGPKSFTFCLHVPSGFTGTITYTVGNARDAVRGSLRVY